MTEAIFWKLIDTAIAESKGSLKNALNILEEDVAKLPGDQILRFDLILHETARVGYRSNMLAAAYIINAGSDLDDLNDFLGFVIMQGQAIWQNALKNPDSLADIEIEDEALCTEIWELPEKAYERSTSQEDFEMIHFDYPVSNLIGTLQTWYSENDKADKEKLKELLPNLYNKWWE